MATPSELMIPVPPGSSAVGLEYPTFCGLKREEPSLSYDLSDGHGSAGGGRKASTIASQFVVEVGMTEDAILSCVIG